MRVAVWALGALVLALALAQLILPRIAASRIRSRVGRYGGVQSVSVSAWPAVELLWGEVGSVKVRARSLALSPSQAASLLWEGRGASSMDLSAQSVRLGSLRLSDARVEKRGSALSAHALASEAAVKAALPEGLAVSLLRSEGGEVEVRATGGLFGVDASVNAVASASAGKLVVRPVGFLLQALQLTLFSDPHVYVQGVGASVARRRPLGYRLTIAARLR